jgi:hypothetical protein
MNLKPVLQIRFWLDPEPFGMVCCSSDFLIERLTSYAPAQLQFVIFLRARVGSGGSVLAVTWKVGR